MKKFGGRQNVVLAFNYDYNIMLEPSGNYIILFFEDFVLYYSLNLLDGLGGGGGERDGSQSIYSERPFYCYANVQMQWTSNNGVAMLH